MQTARIESMVSPAVKDKLLLIADERAVSLSSLLRTIIVEWVGERSVR